MHPLATRALVLLSALACSCRDSADSGYRPGLGEIMSLQQMRHSKLWLAAEAGNWRLAAYETEELAEGFADAVRFHPVHEGSPIPLTEAVPTYTKTALDSVRTAILERDEVRFAQAFDTLTAGCNGCHLATNFPFNVIIRPTANCFANQDFTGGAK
jgi:hypothetical protein